MGLTGRKWLGLLEGGWWDKLGDRGEGAQTVITPGEVSQARSLRRMGDISWQSLDQVSVGSFLASGESDGEPCQPH